MQHGTWTFLIDSTSHRHRSSLVPWLPRMDLWGIRRKPRPMMPTLFLQGKSSCLVKNIMFKSHRVLLQISFWKYSTWLVAPHCVKNALSALHWYHSRYSECVWVGNNSQPLKQWTGNMMISNQQIGLASSAWVSAIPTKLVAKPWLSLLSSDDDGHHVPMVIFILLVVKKSNPKTHKWIWVVKLPIYQYDIPLNVINQLWKTPLW